MDDQRNIPVDPSANELVIREVTVFDYGSGGAVGVPKEVATQFGISVGAKAEWFVVQLAGRMVLGLRAVGVE